MILEIISDNNKKKYWIEALENAAIKQLTDEYQQKGYMTSINNSDLAVDLRVKNDTEEIAFVVKSGKMTKSASKKIVSLVQKCKKKGIKLQYVLINDPKTKSIEFEGIEDTFYSYLINNMPSDLDELSPYTVLDSVSNIEINKCDVTSGDAISLKGNGDVVVILNDNDKDIRYSESFPFAFDVNTVFDNKWIINDVNKLQFNTSNFYN